MIRGVLDERWSDWFNGLTIETEGSVTTLTGAVDQSGLHGILTRIGDLMVISVAKIESERKFASITRR